MTKITESNMEELAIEILEAQGWQYLPSEDQEAECALVESNKKLIEIYEQKTKDVIGKLWKK